MNRDSLNLHLYFYSNIYFQRMQEFFWFFEWKDRSQQIDQSTDSTRYFLTCYGRSRKASEGLFRPYKSSIPALLKDSLPLMASVAGFLSMRIKG